MFSYSNNGVTISTILDSRRKLVSGLYPIKIRVNFRRKRKYYSTGKELSECDWEHLNTAKSRKLSAIRKDIQFSFENVKAIVMELEHKGEFSFETLNSRLGRGNYDTINTAFEVKMETLLENKQIGTRLFYQDAYQSIQKFAGRSIYFSDITVEWLQKYEQYFIGLGRSYTTLGMYCRAIRHLMNEAKKNGIITETQYPFGVNKYHIKKGESRKLALTMQQIKQLVTYEDGTECTEKYRDLWFFSYLCNGINFSDLVKLRYENISNGELYFVRTKTAKTSKEKKEICVIVTPEMENIIKRWGNRKKSGKTFIFPYLNEGDSIEEEKKKVQYLIRHCNKRLRMISETLGLPKVTTYTARHSYATVLKRSGANIAYISESLGHSDLKTTENYLASFEREEREKNARLLTNFE